MENNHVIEYKLKLLFKIFKLLNYDVNSIQDVLNITLSQDEIRNPELIDKMYKLIDLLKDEYKSQMLTCLHKNSLQKQKFPALNMIRQLCKCNNLKVSPFVVCKGYNKSTGRKIVERYYKINFIE